MRVTLFGGAFDPPHKGHLQVASSVIQQQLTDQIWFLPSGHHPFDKDMSSSFHRLNMLQRARQTLTEESQAVIKIHAYELETMVVTYTVDTLRHFSRIYPDIDFSWLIGADNVAGFTKWKNYEWLLKHFTVYVYPRLQHPLTEVLPGMEVLHDLPPVAVSSTEVRERVVQGLPIAGLVPEPVNEYIKLHRLYQKVRLE